MVTMTFTVDDETARTLRTTAGRLRKSQSLVIREAVAEYAARAGRAAGPDAHETLADMTAAITRPTRRSETELDGEIETIRHSGVLGGGKRRRG